MSRRRDQHFARSRTGFRKRSPGSAYAGASAGSLQAEDRIEVDGCGRRELRLDLFPIEFELFGEEHGESGDDALAHLGLVDHDCDRVIGSDTHPGIHGSRFNGRSCGQRFEFSRQVKTKDQPGSSGGTFFQEFAAQHHIGDIGN